MTQAGYSNAIVNLMLGWLKGLAGWVLKLFNLAGSGGNPLLWISQNWLKLLIVLLIVGMVMDWLIWMIRWRPYWVWFRKKRIIVNDESILRDGELIDAEEDDDILDQSYVVPSTVVKRRETSSGRRGNDTGSGRGRRAAGKDILSDDLFEVGHEHDDFFDLYEDEVFNVKSLPDSQEEGKKTKKRRR